MLGSLAEGYRRGVEWDWQAFEAGYHRYRIALPTYYFDRERYWHPDADVNTTVNKEAEYQDWLYEVSWHKQPRKQA